MNNFDHIAIGYDLLKRLIYGNQLDEAAGCYLHLIPAGAKVLIIGGGSGKLLESISDCEITYIEKSIAMITLAGKRKSRTVNFVHMDFLQYEPDKKFDFVVCPFFLDVFTPENLSSVLKKIKACLNGSGRLIITDFEPNTFLQRRLVDLMYLFFRMVAVLEAKKLLPLHEEITNMGFKLAEKRIFLKGLVVTRVYSL